MPKSPAYMKEYRLRNRDKLRAYEKIRNAKRRASRREPSAVKPDAISPIPKAVYASAPIARGCQSPYCLKQGHQVQVHGMVAWLCVEHGPRV